jgi:hypothetical protein
VDGFELVVEIKEKVSKSEAAREKVSGYSSECYEEIEDLVTEQS